MATSDRTARADSSRRARARILVLAMGLSVAALGCSDDDSATPRTTTTTDDDASTASTTSSSSTTSTSETTGTTSPAPPTDQSVEDEITARYLGFLHARLAARSAEHTSELQSLMRISSPVLCSTQPNQPHHIHN